MFLSTQFKRRNLGYAKRLRSTAAQPRRHGHRPDLLGVERQTDGYGNSRIVPKIEGWSVTRRTAQLGASYKPTKSHGLSQEQGKPKPPEIAQRWGAPRIRPSLLGVTPMKNRTFLNENPLSAAKLGAIPAYGK